MDVERIYITAFKEQLDFINKLDSKYITAIKNYAASDYYQHLNRTLCAGLPLSGVYETTYKDLMQVFSLVPRLNAPVVVWRGIRASALNEARLSCQFVSTSLSVKAATRPDFVGSACCVLKITLPAGAHVLPLEYHAEQSGEWEVLLPPNGTWTVLSSEELPYTDPFSTTKTYRLTYNITYIPEKRVVLNPTQPAENTRKLLQLKDDENTQRILRAVSKDEFDLLYDGVLSEENILDYINYIAKHIGALPLPPMIYENVLEALK